MKLTPETIESIITLLTIMSFLLLVVGCIGLCILGSLATDASQTYQLLVARLPAPPKEEERKDSISPEVLQALYILLRGSQQATGDDPLAAFSGRMSGTKGGR